MTVFRNEGQWDTSNVEFADGRILAYDKTNRTPRMRHIDYGLGVFRRAGIRRACAPGSVYDLAARLSGSAGAGELAALGSRRSGFYEIGSADRNRRSFPRSYLTNDDVSPDSFLRSARKSSRSSTTGAIERVVATAGRDAATRGGRLFILGVGGSAANASHAVNDFRKIAGIEAYAPTDNVAELTARTNDEGWASVFEALAAGQPAERERCGPGLFRGRREPGKERQRRIWWRRCSLPSRPARRIAGIVGRDGGYTAQVADACVIVPTVNPAHVTPHAEAFQAVIWHLIVSHPAIKRAETKWESVR